jgi:hypothetical protein
MSSTTDFMSFYIPYVPKHWNEESLRKVFSDLQIGFVDRVDFFDTGKWTHALSAFVHLNYWACSQRADKIYNRLDSVGSCKLVFDTGDYFILRKMTCEKIPATHLNVHQLASKMADMEQEVHFLRAELSAALAKDVTEEPEPEPDFYTNYEDGGPLSMSELANQTQEFDECCRNSERWWRANDERSETSSQGSAKRMRMSEELCGNN